MFVVRTNYLLYQDHPEVVAQSLQLVEHMNHWIAVAPVLEFAVVAVDAAVPAVAISQLVHQVVAVVAAFAVVVVVAFPSVLVEDDDSPLRFVPLLFPYFHSLDLPL